MRRFAQILRPILAAVLALALAVAGSIIGARLLAAPEDVVVAETTQATVLPALPADALPPSFDDDDDLAGLVETLPPASPTIEVPIGYDAAGELAEFDAVLAEVEESADPEGAAFEAFRGSDLVPPADPCVADPDDCPAGLLSTVLGFRTPGPLPALRIVRAGIPERGSGWASACRTEGTVSFAVETNQPVDGEMVYTPRDNLAVVSRAVIQTPERDALDWRALYYAGADSDPVPTVIHCLPLTFRLAGLHDAVLNVYSEGGSVTLRTQFDSSGELSVPKVAIFTPFDDVITVIAPYRSSENVVVELHTIVERSTVDDPALLDDLYCNASADEGDAGIRSIGGPRLWSVPRQALVDRNEDPAYTERRTESWSVQEGTTTLVCVKIQNGATIERLMSAVVSTRDVPLPVISVWGVENATPDNLIVQGYTGNGSTCGEFRAEPHLFTSFGDGRTICDFRAGAGSAGVEAPGRREVPLSDGYLSGYTVRFWPELQPDRAFTSTIDLDGLLCRGAPGCIPDPTYHVAQDPVSGSTVVFKVSWTTGTGTNGAPATTVSRIVDDPTGFALAGFFNEPYPVLSVGHSYVVPSETASGSEWRLRARASEAATYLIRLVPGPGEVGVCLLPGSTETLVRTGEFPGSADPATLPPAEEFTFRDLCPGTTYQLQVTLTAMAADSAGAAAVSVWGSTPDMDGAPVNAYYGGDFIGSRRTTTPNEYRLRIGIEVIGEVDPATGVAAVTPKAVSLAVNGLNFVRDAQFCPTTTGVSGESIYPDRMVDTGTGLHISGTIQSTRGGCPRGSAVAPDPELIPVTFAFDVSVAEVLAAGADYLPVTIYRDVTYAGVGPGGSGGGTVRIPVMRLLLQFL